MKYSFVFLAGLGLVSAGPVPMPQAAAKRLRTREVPQEHSHNHFVDLVRTSLALDNPKGIVDPIFGLLGNAAAAAGAGSVTNLDCLQQETADQAFTNAKAAGDIPGMAGALVYRAIERNTGAVGQASVLCTETAANPEIAALSQHQDPASANAASINKGITLALAQQLAAIGADPLLALESGTFAPGTIGDPTAAGNTCDTADDEPGCIFTQNLLVLDATEAEISAAVAGITPTFTGTGVISATDVDLAKLAVATGATVSVTAAAAASTTAAASVSAAASVTDDSTDCTLSTVTVMTTVTADAAAAAASGSSCSVVVKTVAATDAAALASSTVVAAAAAAAAASSTAAAASSSSTATSNTTTTKHPKHRHGHPGAHAKIAAAAAGGAGHSVHRRAALDFGSCADPTILFEAGLDGRNTEAFIAADQTDFNHGSALNIAVIAGFICQRLGSPCNAAADAQAACTSASAAAVATTQNQAAADVFNSILGVGGAAAAAATSTAAASSAAVTSAASVSSAAAAASSVVVTVTQCS